MNILINAIVLAIGCYTPNMYAYDNEIVCGQDNTSLTVGDSSADLLSQCGVPTETLNANGRTIYTYVINNSGVITHKRDGNIGRRITITIEGGSIISVE